MEAGESKVCTKCSVMKPLTAFSLCCYGYNGLCKVCVKAKNAAYYRANKGTIVAKHAERIKSGAKPKVGAVEARQAVPFDTRYAERRAKVNKNKRDRHAADPQVRAKIYVETKLRRALADQGPKLEEMVGCTADHFQEWIEYQLAEGMTSDNYGTAWTYDHVIPKSAFDFKDPKQVKQCNHWSNWRPITGPENSMKHDKRDPELEARHAMLAYIFQIIQDAWLLRGNNAQV